jgi:hypothetical protein
MSEFWAASPHRRTEEVRFFMKQPASAAHTYGLRIVAAEGFTTVGPHWQETLWDNLKPSFDRAACEGMNRLVWHAFVCSPAGMGVPGQQYFAGTHFNPNTTWWNKSAPFLSYLNRCQFLLQQGLFVGDACYYYGDWVPNFAQLKRSDPARVLPGFDYDVASKEVVLTRMSVRDGRIVLPDGMSYRVLVLPNRDVISLPVLKKIKELVADGATIIGPKPLKGETLENFPECDVEIAKIANELWNGKVGPGRVIADKTAREVLLADGVKPDCEFLSTLNSSAFASGYGATAPERSEGGQPSINFDYIHRTADGAEIYFVANRTNVTATAIVAFRVSGKAPELWNAVTGEHKFAVAYEEKDGRTFVPLDFDPCGSWFVVFREPTTAHPATAKSNSETFSTLAEISGAWMVHFDPKWGGPESAQFDELVSWSVRTEPGIKFYSGTATYEKTFDLPQSATRRGEASGEARVRNPQSKLWLDLGNVHELAEVRVNGKSCGTTWAPPFRVDVTDAVRPGENKLEIEVVNFWPNRIIGDASLPPAQRLTRTNIRKLTANTPLMESGLIGPVRLLETGQPQ